MQLGVCPCPCNATNSIRHSMCGRRTRFHACHVPIDHQSSKQHSCLCGTTWESPTRMLFTAKVKHQSSSKGLLHMIPVCFFSLHRLLSNKYMPVHHLLLTECSPQRSVLQNRCLILVSLVVPERAVLRYHHCVATSWSTQLAATCFQIRLVWLQLKVQPR